MMAFTRIAISTLSGWAPMPSWLKPLSFVAQLGKKRWVVREGRPANTFPVNALLSQQLANLQLIYVHEGSVTSAPIINILVRKNRIRPCMAPARTPRGALLANYNFKQRSFARRPTGIHQIKRAWPLARPPCWVRSRNRRGFSSP